jgi:hypothetical protein
MPKEISNPNKSVAPAKCALPLQQVIATTINKQIALASKAQLRIVAAGNTAVVAAIEAGKALLEIKALSPPGQWLQIVEDGFCSPHQLSVKTAQRYMTLARQSSELCQHLREQSLELAACSDEELLEQMSINQALTTVQQLKLTSPASAPGQARQAEPGRTASPDAWWISPEYAALVRNIYNEIVSDLTDLPGQNPLAAQFSWPIDSLPQIAELQAGLHWGNPGCNSTQLAQLCQFAVSAQAKSPELEFLLLLPANTNQHWCNLLAGYPRAYYPNPLPVRRAGSKTNKPLSTPMMLVFVGRSENFPVFGSAFSSSHQVFFPYSESGAVHDTPPQLA